jgi:Arc/MetJ-type ribon-helix-helix transcriptional regulator
MMSVIQARLPQGLVNEIDTLVKNGLYNNRSDVVRDAVRRLAIKRMIGIIPNTRDSVKEIREIRKKLSKEIKNFSDIEEINKLIE